MRINLQKKRILAMAILLASCGLPSLAQELLRVNGVVLDKDANPMIGVTVRPEGTSTGTVTDLDGHFSIQVKRGAKLSFSYLGYRSAVATATSNMKEVKAEDMEHRTITDANQALQGKTSGVQVITTSAAPGSTPTVRIRGYSSNVSSSPLYVVDGRADHNEERYYGQR